MKNKKLIATVASLCLVLVAVVAAVVGVLAAARQNVTNKVKVSYVANNVNADVTLASRTESGTFASSGTKTSHHFAPQDGVGTATLDNTDISLSWSSTDSDGTLNHYVVYQFKFENKSATRPLEVLMTYTESAVKNVTLRWYKSASATIDPAVTYNEATGVLNAATNSPLNVESGTQFASYAHGKDNENKVTIGEAIPAVKTPTADGTQIAYIYLVVAITDLNADAEFGLGGSTTYDSNTLAFELNSILVGAAA